MYYELNLWPDVNPSRTHSPTAQQGSSKNALLNYAESIFLAKLPNNIAGTKAKLGLVFLSSLDCTSLVGF